MLLDQVILAFYYFEKKKFSVNSIATSITGIHDVTGMVIYHFIIWDYFLLWAYDKFV